MKRKSRRITGNILRTPGRLVMISHDSRQTVIDEIIRHSASQICKKEDVFIPGRVFFTLFQKLRHDRFIQFSDIGRLARNACSFKSQTHDRRRRDTVRIDVRNEPDAAVFSDLRCADRCPFLEFQINFRRTRPCRACLFRTGRVRSGRP